MKVGEGLRAKLWMWPRGGGHTARAFTYAGGCCIPNSYPIDVASRAVGECPSILGNSKPLLSTQNGILVDPRVLFFGFFAFENPFAACDVIGASRDVFLSAIVDLCCVLDLPTEET